MAKENQEYSLVQQLGKQIRAVKRKTGAGKSGGGEQKLGTMKAASELQQENKQNTSDRRAAHHKHRIK
jgi:hypothetical protein